MSAALASITIHGMSDNIGEYPELEGVSRMQEEYMDTVYASHDARMIRLGMCIIGLFQKTYATPFARDARFVTDFPANRRKSLNGNISIEMKIPYIPTDSLERDSLGNPQNIDGMIQKFGRSLSPVVTRELLGYTIFKDTLSTVTARTENAFEQHNSPCVTWSKWERPK